jgi:hypothetical protein
MPYVLGLSGMEHVRITPAGERFRDKQSQVVFRLEGVLKSRCSSASLRDQARRSRL